MIKAAIFDLYNTLAYIKPDVYRDTKRKMASEIGITEDLFIEIWRQYSRANNRGDMLTVEERVAKVLRELGVDINRAIIRQLADYEYDLQENHVQLIDYAEATLLQLKNMNLKIGLITNTGFSTKNAVDILGIRKYFDCIILSYQLRLLKPGSYVYHYACKQIDVTPEECIYVGDGDDSELEGAFTLDMYTVLLKDEGRERITHTKSVPNYNETISRLDMLLPLVTSLNTTK